MLGTTAWASMRGSGESTQAPLVFPFTPEV